MNGFSLQDLSDALKGSLSKQALQRFESGEAEPDSEELSQVAGVLGQSADFFFREQSVVLEDLRFRKLKKLPVKEQEKVVAQTTDFLERYLELESILGIERKLGFRPRHRKINAPHQIEEAAEALRKHWRLGDDALPNVVEMLEENNIMVCQLKVDPAFSGMSTILSNEVAVVVLNQDPEIPVVRRRFSALHEVAHLYLDLSSMDEKGAEKTCDAFASAMLIPEIKLKVSLGNHRSTILTAELKMIGAQYGISMSAIGYRAFTVGIISASYHKLFMIRYNKYGMRGEERKIYEGSEHSNRFLHLLIRAVAEEIISTSKAASLNNQKLADFRKMVDEPLK